MHTIQIKRSNISSIPSNLSFGEFSISSLANDSNIYIGSSSNTIVPVNAMKIYITTNSNYTILQWNSCLIVNSGLLSISTITLPQANTFNIGQSIFIKNTSGLNLIIAASGSGFINSNQTFTLALNSVAHFISGGLNQVYSL